MTKVKVRTPFVTREAWLQAFAESVRPWFTDIGLTVPEVRIGVGFTSKGARSKRIGECWHSESSADGVPQVFVHPGTSDPEAVATTVLHELIHAAVGPGHKHGPVFKAPALALGFEGPMTATPPSPELLARLAPVLKVLGPYPHGALSSLGTGSNGPKQTTRMVKVECGTCGYLVRTSQKWIDVAVPECPVDRTPMDVAA